VRDAQGQSSTPVVVEHDGTRQEIQLPISATGDIAAITHLLVTTKAYDVSNAVADVAHRLDERCQLLLLVNGMGLAEALHLDHPALDIYCGTTTEGAYRVAPRHIHHAGTGQTRIGKAGQRGPAPWFGQWPRAIDNCTWDAAIDEALWLKLAINCAINPLTAIHDCRNGELAQRQHLTSELNELCNEIATISRAAGFENTAANLKQAVNAVVAGTADNHSSMLQDVRAGRRTEIDHITGYLLAAARRHGIAAPHNTTLLASIHDIDR
jgi:2-dehydropantoate 2-reductase